MGVARLFKSSILICASAIRKLCFRLLRKIQSRSERIVMGEIVYLQWAILLTAAVEQSKETPPTTHSSITEPFLSIVGGGLVAAALTLGFNAWWDKRKQKLTEDWEFKRYEANQIHYATMGLVEAFFAAKAEMYYLNAVLGTLLGTLNQLAAQADAIVRQQGGPQLTVGELDERKRQLLEPFRNFNQQQVNLRWNHSLRVLQRVRFLTCFPF